MGTHTKGDLTRKKIIDDVNWLFNKNDKLLTLDELAGTLEINRSRITNYFPKKEHLILAIFEQYQLRLQEIIEQNQPDTEHIGFPNLIGYYSRILDLSYEFRFTISYVFVYPPNDSELRDHITNTYAGNKQRISNRLQSLVNSGLLEGKILEPENFEVFIFQHVNLLTTWIISYRIYDHQKSYEQMKPTYLRGIMNCYHPYLTPKGKGEIEEAMNVPEKL